MNSLNQTTYPRDATRLLAGVLVPDTPIVTRAIEYAREHCEPYLFNHEMRSWLFSVAIAQLKGAPHNPEVSQSPRCCTTSAWQKHSAARCDSKWRAPLPPGRSRAQGMVEGRAQLVWDGVALNSTPSIGLYKEGEVALCTLGIGLDWGGWGYDTLTQTQVATILEAFPRLEMKRQFTRDVCRIVESRPDTTYDNFARDFGERFVPGYTRPSTVDLLLNAPFQE